MPLISEVNEGRGGDLTPNSSADTSSSSRIDAMKNLLNVNNLGGGGGGGGEGIGGIGGNVGSPLLNPGGLLGEVGGLPGLGGLPGSGGNMFEGMDKQQMMQMQMAMLTQLEKTDPKKFDEVMTALEEDLKKTCEEQGIDMDEVNKKYDAQIAQEQRAAAGNDVKLPGGKVMDADGKGTRGKQEGINITPVAHFSIKTKDSDGVKAFINVCSHEALSEPAPQKKLDAEGNEVEGLRVPVAVGEERRFVDDKGVGSRTVDCIVNPKVIAESSEDKTGQYRDWICQLVIQYVEQKFKVQLDKRYKLPKLKYHAYINKLTGEVVAKTHENAVVSSQWVRDVKKEHKIEEVDDGTKKKDKDISAKKSSKISKGTKAAAAKIPKVPMSSKKIPVDVFFENADGNTINILDYNFGSDHELLLSDLAKANVDNLSKSQCLMEPVLRNPIADANDADFVSHVVLRVSLPADSGPNAEVDLSAFVCSVGAPGFLKTEVILPYPVEWKKGVTNSYSPSANLLTVRAKISFENWSEMESAADVGSRQWQLSAAIGGSSSGNSGGGKKESGGDNGEVSQGKQSAASTDKNLAEDKFHLNLPNGYNPMSGLRQDEDASEDENDFDELPEDRFHKNDIMSQHILEKQAKERQDKIEKSDKERAERKKKKKEGGDEDIEYLDVDDFKPGGKYYSGGLGGNIKDEPGNLYADGGNEDLTKAMEYMKVQVGGGENEICSENDDNCEKKKFTLKKKPKLNSGLWTELLD